MAAVTMDRFVDGVIRASGAIRAVSGTAAWYLYRQRTGAPGRTSHNPPVVGSSPTRPTSGFTSNLGRAVERIDVAGPVYRQARLAPRADT